MSLLATNRLVNVNEWAITGTYGPEEKHEFTPCVARIIIFQRENSNYIIP